MKRLEKDIKSKETETQVRTLGLPSAINTPTFDLSAAKLLAAKKLAAAHGAAEKLVLEQIDKNISDKSLAKEFVRQGLDLVQADCPFCGQDLKTAANLLEAYREFFDDAFHSFQTELSQAAASLDNWNVENGLTALVSSHNANTATVRQWEPFIGAEVLPDTSAFVETARTKLTASKSKVLAELEKKQRDPNADCDLSQFDTMAAALEFPQIFGRILQQGRDGFHGKGEGLTSTSCRNQMSIPCRLPWRRSARSRNVSTVEWKRWATDYPTAKKDASDLLVKKSRKAEGA